MTTKIIAGFEITLESGNRYRASRPMASIGRRLFPVFITQLNEEDIDEKLKIRLSPMSYDDANEFLSAFNNGTTSFDGRIW